VTILRKQWKKKLRIQIIIWSGVALLLAWSIKWLEFDFGILFSSGPRFSDFFTRLNPPDWSVSSLIFHSMIETLLIAFVGTALAILISLPLGFLAATNITPGWVHHSIKSENRGPELNKIPKSNSNHLIDHANKSATPLQIII